MTKITFFLWLPIADNMIEEIREKLKARGAQFSDNIAHPELEYKIALTPDAEALTICGHYSNQGWTRHSLEMPEYLDNDNNFHGRVSTLVAELARRTLTLLFASAPLAVKNKLAVLHEGIVARDTFEHILFESSIDSPAQSLMGQLQLAVVYTTNLQLFRSLSADDTALTRDPVQQQSVALALPKTRRTVCVLVDDIEKLTPEGVEAYCCLHIMANYSKRVIDVLKATREHVVPLRRQVAIALQKNTRENSELLVRVKRYLTYVHIKLPVIDKIATHLATVTGQTGALMTMINRLDKVESYGWLPFYKAMNQRRSFPKDWLDTPPRLSQALNSDRSRMTSLSQENSDELQVLSSEVTHVLETTHLSEIVQLLLKQASVSN